MRRTAIWIVLVGALAALLAYSIAWRERAAIQRRAEAERAARRAEVVRLNARLASRPDDPALLSELGMEYWAGGELDDAETAFKRALAAGADSTTELDLVSLLYHRGRYVEAAGLTKQLIGARTAAAPKWLTDLRARFAASTASGPPPARTVELRRVDGSFVNSIGMMFVEIPGGSFARGDNRGDRQARVVSISPYFIGQYEVTAGEVQQFLEETTYAHFGLAPDPADPKVSAYPIAGVSWLDAEAFAIWLSLRERAVYRLPTEAEWEFAARGPHGYREPWGNARGKAQVDGNWRAGFDGRRPLLRPVGSFPRDRSPFGLFDMAGNVTEWCIDEYADDYFSWSPVRNPFGPTDYIGAKVLRGGAWNHPGPGNFAIERGEAGGNQGYTGYGFRLVREISVESAPHLAPRQLRIE